MVEVETFEGFQKNSAVYASHGFYYHKNHVMKGGRLSLRCTLHPSCPGRASCNSERKHFRVTTRHNHAGNRSFQAKRELRRKVLDRCRTMDPTPFHDIVEQEGQGYSRRVRAANDPIMLRSAMRRARLDRYPNIPATLSDLGNVLRKKRNRGITATKDGTQSILFGVVGSSQRKTRSIIFMSKRQQKRLQRARILFADGTFNSRPAKPKSRQVFNICTRTKDRRAVPLVTILMQSKSEESYEKVLSILRDAGCNPRVVHTDFEAAQYNAWKNVFGRRLKVDGCLYHYVVRLRKKAKKLGLSRHLQDRVTDSIVCSCNALPLLPRRRIRAGLASIVRRARRHGLLRLLRPFLRYVKQTWLPRSDILSIFYSEDRTNNVSESWNNVLNSTVKVKRPNVWIFLDALKRLEERSAQDLYKLKKGWPVSRLRKASAVRNDRMIHHLTRSLNAREISMTDFLKSASKRMMNVWRPVYGN